jgi:hypothetical protein
MELAGTNEMQSWYKMGHDCRCPGGNVWACASVLEEGRVGVLEKSIDLLDD